MSYLLERLEYPWHFFDFPLEKKKADCPSPPRPPSPSPCDFHAYKYTEKERGWRACVCDDCASWEWNLYLMYNVGMLTVMTSC